MMLLTNSHGLYEKVARHHQHMQESHVGNPSVGGYDSEAIVRTARDRVERSQI